MTEFVEIAEYLVDLNATQAAIRAGYSAKNAGKIGFQLLEKTRIAEAISAGQRSRFKRLEIDADMVAANVPKWRRWLAYKAVRIGGAKSYRNGVNEFVEIPDS